MQPRKLQLVLVVVAFFLTLLPAQDYPRYPAVGSTYVPLDSWIYPALERLAARGYINTAFMGLRPWTRAECARLIDEAGEGVQQEDTGAAVGILLYQALEKEFAGELGALGGGSNRGFRLESIYTRFTDRSSRAGFSRSTTNGESSIFTNPRRCRACRTDCFSFSMRMPS